MHVNAQVRAAVAARLDGLANLVSVTSNRGSQLLDQDLPAAMVATAEDVVEAATKDGDQRRQIQLAIVLIMDAAMDQLDDAADALRSSVEVAMSDDLGGLAKDIEHTGGSLEVMSDEDGDRWYAFLTLRWTVDVWTVTGDPETAR